MAVIFVIVTAYVIVNLRRKLYGVVKDPGKVENPKNDEIYMKNIGMVTVTSGKNVNIVPPVHNCLAPSVTSSLAP